MRRCLLSSLIFLWMASSVLAAKPADLEEEVRRIAAELRCVVCQNLSVADSPSELAQQMRTLIREQLQQGKTAEEIKDYFVSRYGEWVLLSPTPKGFNLLVWLLPFVAVGSGIVLAAFLLHRWTKKKNIPRPAIADPALIERVKREAIAEGSWPIDPQGENPRSLLLRERARLYAELRELEFDYQAGKLSGKDYQSMRQGIESQAAMVLRELEVFPPADTEKEKKTSAANTAKETKEPERKKSLVMDWRLVAGGIFLLMFGITLGVLLARSLRPRASDQDSITGDFLTGTGSGDIRDSLGTDGKEIPSLLAQGRAAFERQEWPKAIDAFRKVLAIDANHPEAHTYMGLILAQAGHADGALLAFDRALSADANFPLALWGKGMLLYRAKEDYSGARETLEKLLSIVPPGEEKKQLQKTVAEIAELSSRQRESAKKSKSGSPAPQAQQIRGTISVDPNIQSKWNGQGVLFIIAHPAGSQAGPPLAVKKIEHPVFPLSYSLGSENVMMQGMPFSGKVLLSARLDKDGNPMTKEPGNLMGEYRKNPVEIGSQKVDIVLDQVQ